MTDDVARKIIAIIAEQAMLDPEQIRMDAAPDTLGLDSLGMVEVVFGIEEAFDISVPFHANAVENPEFDVSTVGKIVDAVKRLIDEKA